MVDASTTHDSAYDKPEVTEDKVKRRIGRYDHYYDMRTSSWTLRKTSKPKRLPKKPRERKHAVVIKRQIDERGRYTGNVIEIKSEDLCNILLEINNGVESLNLSRSEPQADPETLFHSYPPLLERLAAEEQKDTPDKEVILDLKAILCVIEDDQEKTIRDVAKLTSKQEITYDLLWAIFTPNTLVYNRHRIEEDRLMLGRQTSYHRRISDGTLYFSVECEMLHNDGYAFGFARQTLEIEKFQGALPITDLPIYPLKYHLDKDGVYARAVDLGKMFVKMKRHSFHEINRTTSNVKSVERVMISPYAYRQYAGANDNPRVRRAISKEPEGLTDNDYAICTPILLGFSFKRKAWGLFPMSLLREVEWNDEAFKALVLGDKQKHLIHALVSEHASQPSSMPSRFDDVIEGKGRGLIGLLAGTPGCGKTLTAEAVAETTRKPLYTVSAGQLGTKPEQVEESLVRAMELAQMWDAVLLLDEAEVFLQQRSVNDMKRNALVSIFLRQLEYYQGILILTTNMPEQCDAAFESRIHFSVNYPKLDQAARKAVWSTFFRRASIEIDDAELERLASREINGRQIKNAFSSATIIAKANGSQMLSVQDVDVVLSVLNDWQMATQKHTKVESLDMLF